MRIFTTCVILERIDENPIGIAWPVVQWTESRRLSDTEQSLPGRRGLLADLGF